MKRENKKLSPNDRLEKVFLSVVIPIFNESERIINLLAIHDYLNKQRYSWEIILVNDGSQDDTLGKVKLLRKKIKFRLLSYTQNRGKGYAIKYGMLSAKGKFRLFLDIDLSTPIEEFENFAKHLESNHVVIGTRKAIKSKLKIRQPRLRESLGKVFTKLSQVLLNVRVSDFTCGFKCFSDESARKIFPRQTIERWGFDSEILFLANKMGYKIKEVPVTWKNDARTKVKFPDDIFRSLHDLLKIRYNHTRQRYQL